MQPAATTGPSTRRSHQEPHGRQAQTECRAAGRPCQLRNAPILFRGQQTQATGHRYTCYAESISRSVRARIASTSNGLKWNPGVQQFRRVLNGGSSRQSPVTMATGVLACRGSDRSSKRKPNPPIPGILRSSRMASGLRPRWIRSSAASAFSATTGNKPPHTRTRANKSRMDGSSSMTRTIGPLARCPTLGTCIGPACRQL